MRTTRCRFLFVVGAIALLVAGITFIPAPAMAQAPSTIFQLDGNPANDSLTCTYGTPCDYWNLINLAGSSGSGRGHSAVNSFILGTATTDSFTGGGSKDSNLLSQWAYSGSPTPNKDTLNAGYAAAYQITDFDVIFGADRASPNGDANIGIWFFQQNVTLNGTGGFNGAHVKGDVFVISAFTGGGGTSTISVYEWDPACSASNYKNPSVGGCAATNLRLLASPTAVCGSSAYCAITNSGTVSASWASYSGGSLASPLFFEGGVDITAAFASVGGTVPCFASFLEETRSSQSTTAVLKDFLLGSFPVCSMSISKSCGTAAANANGTAFNYPVSGSVTNTGVGTISGIQVQDCIAGSWSLNSSGVEVCSGTVDTVNISNNTTGSPNIGTNTLAKGESGTWTDSSSSTATSQSDQAYATGTAAGAPVQSTNFDAETCSASANSALVVTKTCSTTLQTASNGTTVDVQVSYGGQICNNGNGQVTGITLTDYPDSIAITGGTGTPLTGTYTLAPGTCTLDSNGNPIPSTCTSCVSYGPFAYAPTTIDETINGGAGAGRYFFDDLVTVPTASATIGTLSKVTSTDSRTNGKYGFATARCPICQGADECTTQ